MIDINHIWLVLVAIGVPSAVVGILTRRIEKKMDKAEKLRADLDDARIQHETLLIEAVMVSMALGEATAEAVQRIPDAHCNGEMEHALSRSKEVQERYRAFEREQVAKKLND